MGSSVARVAEGGRLSEEVGAAFSRILAAVDSTSQSIGEIRNAMLAQETSTQDVVVLLDKLQGARLRAHGRMTPQGSPPLQAQAQAHVRVRVGDCHIAIAAAHVERALAIRPKAWRPFPAGRVRWLE